VIPLHLKSLPFSFDDIWIPFHSVRDIMKMRVMNVVITKPTRQPKE
jgi:hypothetical protein